MHYSSKNHLMNSSTANTQLLKHLASPQIELMLESVIELNNEPCTLFLKYLVPLSLSLYLINIDDNSISTLSQLEEDLNNGSTKDNIIRSNDSSLTELHVSLSKRRRKWYMIN